MSLFRARIWHYFISRLPKRVITTETEHGTFSYYNKDLIGRYLYVDKSFELDKIKSALEILEHLELLSKNNNTLLDVGANIGTVCVPLVKSGYFKNALAFEPEPNNHKLLRRNISQNNLEDKIESFNLALSNSAGKLFMALNENNYGDHRIKTKVTAKDKVVEVNVVKLDEFLNEQSANIEDLSLLWMDVQGYELLVLEGAKGIIQRGLPVVSEFAPECIFDAGITKDDFIKRISNLFVSYYDLNEKNPVKCEIDEINKLFDKYRDGKFTDLVLLNN